MEKLKQSLVCLFGLLMTLSVMVTAAVPGGKEYKITYEQLDAAKSFFDDPRPVFKGELNYKKIIPPDVYGQLTHNAESMKKVWAEVIGFRAPDVVGKIAPEIKPGRYSYMDKEKYPGLEKLMIPLHYDRFRSSEGPLAGDFSEIEIVPTKQYYYALPIAEATKKHMGAVKQDGQGYIIDDTYVAGFPFARPSGRFKAQQLVYNWEKRYINYENGFLISIFKGLNRKLEQDYEGKMLIWNLKLKGRVTLPPYGWYDQRARANGEEKGFAMYGVSPRDSYGNVINVTKYSGLNKFDQMLVYIAQLRRVRKLSGTDTQDNAAGTDSIYEDSEGFNQKLSPNRFPYEYKIIAEREYLVPAYSEDGSEFFGSKGGLHNLKFQRRPYYVVEMRQIHNNYIYGKRILYIDAETFLLTHIENYDQKGRLYVTMWSIFAFFPEFGNFSSFYVVNCDHLDYHSSLVLNYMVPATWITREHVSMRSILKKGK